MQVLHNNETLASLGISSNQCCNLLWLRLVLLCFLGNVYCADVEITNGQICCHSHATLKQNVYFQTYSFFTTIFLLFIYLKNIYLFFLLWYNVVQIFLPLHQTIVFLGTNLRNYCNLLKLNLSIFLKL